VAALNQVFVQYKRRGGRLAAAGFDGLTVKPDGFVAMQARETAKSQRQKRLDKEKPRRAAGKADPPARSQNMARTDKAAAETGGQPC
jgi:hypothetical protein